MGAQAESCHDAVEGQTLRGHGVFALAVPCGHGYVRCCGGCLVGGLCVPGVPPADGCACPHLAGAMARTRDRAAHAAATLALFPRRVHLANDAAEPWFEGGNQLRLREPLAPGDFMQRTIAATVSPRR